MRGKNLREGKTTYRIFSKGDNVSSGKNLTERKPQQAPEETKDHKNGVCKKKEKDEGGAVESFLLRGTTVLCYGTNGFTLRNDTRSRTYGVICSVRVPLACTE